MSRLAIASGVVLGLIAVTAAHGATQVGSASAVRNDVRGTVAGPMRSGSPVHQSETVSSGSDSSAQLLFRDKTSLTLGPSSQVVIDRFVYNPSTNAGSATVNMTKGALRFVTGSQSSENYTIRTPMASLGIRGTIIESFLVLNYEFHVAVEGSGDVCAGGVCRTIIAPQYVIVFPDGTMSPPADWPGPMLDLTATINFLQAYFTTLLERGSDVLPRYRDINDALRTRDFQAPAAPAPPKSCKHYYCY